MTLDQKVPGSSPGSPGVDKVPKNLSNRLAAQLVPLNLPRRRLGQLGDELDPARVFVDGDPFFDEALQFDDSFIGAGTAS